MTSSFTIRYIVYMSVFLLTFEVFLPDNLMTSFCVFLTQTMYLLISPFTNEIFINKDILGWTDNTFSIQILAECSALTYCSILAAAILSYPAPRALRIKAAILGFVFLQGINVLRLISLLYVGHYWPEQFTWVHQNLWPIFLSVDLVLLYLLWIRHSEKVNTNITKNLESSAVS